MASKALPEVLIFQNNILNCHLIMKILVNFEDIFMLLSLLGNEYEREMVRLKYKAGSLRDADRYV